MCVRACVSVCQLRMCFAPSARQWSSLSTSHWPPATKCTCMCVRPCVRACVCVFVCVSVCARAHARARVSACGTSHTGPAALQNGEFCTNMARDANRHTTCNIACRLNKMQSLTCAPPTRNRHTPSWSGKAVRPTRTTARVCLCASVQVLGCARVRECVRAWASYTCRSDA